MIVRFLAIAGLVLATGYVRPAFAQSDGISPEIVQAGQLPTAQSSSDCEVLFRGQDPETILRWRDCMNGFDTRFDGVPPEIVQAGQLAAAQFSRDCGEHLLDAEPESSLLWKDCMNGFKEDAIPDEDLRFSSTFRLMNLGSKEFLTQDTNNSIYSTRDVTVGKANANLSRDIWVLEPQNWASIHNDPGRFYWESDFRRDKRFYVVNTTSGLVLTVDGEPNTGTDSDLAYLHPRDSDMGNRQLWDWQTLSGIEKDGTHTGLAAGTQGMLVNSHTKKSLTSTDWVHANPGVTSAMPIALWELVNAGKADLAMMDFQSVTAVRTSTGQDAATDALFTGLEAVAEYGPSLATAGAGSLAAAAANAAKAAAQAAAKAAVKAVAKKAAQKIAKELAEAAAKRAAKQVVGGLARYTAKKSAQQASKLASKQLAGIVAKQAAAQTAKRSKKLVVKTLYGQLAKKIGVKGSRALTKTLVEKAESTIVKKMVNTVIEEAIKTAEILGPDAPEEPLELEASDFNAIFDQINNAPGRKDDEGWIQSLFSPFIDDTADDLELRLNDMSVWPNGGWDHRSIGSGSNKPVHVKYVFSRAGGLKINFIEYDSGSDDDDLGEIKMDTADLAELEDYPGAYAYDVDEGSLYEAYYDIFPYYVPTDEERIATALKRKAADQLRLATNFAILKLVDEEGSVNGFARVKAEEERLEQIKRDDILATLGPDGLAHYDNTKVWRAEYAKECRVQDERVLSTGMRDDDFGQYVIPGKWRVGRMDKRGEKDRTGTWELSLDRLSWNSDRGTATGPDFEGIFRSDPFVKFDRTAMMDIVPLVDPTWVRSDREDYCQGIFLISDASRLEPNGNLKYADITHGEYRGKTDTHQTYWPIFRVGKQRPEAYTLNAAGEPILWMEKISDEDPLPQGLCHADDEPTGWKNDHDLDTLMPGTWEAAEISCDTKQPVAGVAKRKWVFTEDHVFVAHTGDREDFRAMTLAWTDTKRACEVAIGSPVDPDQTISLKHNKNGIEGWGFQPNKWLFGEPGSDPKKCYRVQRIGDEVEYDDLMLGERTSLDEYRQWNGKRQPESERKAADKIAADYTRYTDGLTEFQKQDGCGIIGNTFTRISAKFNRGHDTVHIRNDSDAPWSVYWLNNRGQDRMELPSGVKIPPVLVVQPGETGILKSEDDFVYAIYGTDKKYGPSQCVGTVTAKSNAFYTAKVETMFGEEVDGPQVYAKLFTSSYETEKLAKLAEDKRLALEAAREKEFEGLRKKNEKDYQNALKKRAEEDRLANIAAANALVARQKTIVDAKGCLDPQIASAGGNSPTMARIANNGSGDIFAYWVNYEGEFDKSRPTVILRPGDTKHLVDFAGARYMVRDAAQECLAVLTTDGSDWQFTDSGSTTQPGAQEPTATFVPRAALRDFSPAQITNGCEAFGRIASKPAAGRRGITIFNDGAVKMNVSWVSYYGEDETGERERNPGLAGVIAPDGYQTFETLNDGDVFAVTEEDGRCVAIVQASNEETRTRGAAYRFSDWKTLDDKRLAEEAHQARLQAQADEARRLEDIETARQQAERDAHIRKLEEDAARERWLAGEADRNRIEEEERRQRAAEAAEAKRNFDTIEAQRLADIENERRLAAEAEARRLAEETRQRDIAARIKADRLAEDARIARERQLEEESRLAAEAEARRLAEEQARLAALEADRLALMRGNVRALEDRFSNAQCGRTGTLSREDVGGSWDVGPYDDTGNPLVFEGPPALWTFSSGGESFNGETALGAFTSYWSTYGCQIVVSGRVAGFGFEFLANVIHNDDGSKDFYILDEKGELFMWGHLKAPVLTAGQLTIIDEIVRLDRLRGTYDCNSKGRPLDAVAFGDWIVGPYDPLGNAVDLGETWALGQGVHADSFDIKSRGAEGEFSGRADRSECGFSFLFRNSGLHHLSFYRDETGEDFFYVQKDGHLQDSLVMWGVKDHSAENQAAEDDARRIADAEQETRLREEQWAADRRAQDEVKRQRDEDAEAQRQWDAEQARLRADEDEALRLAAEEEARARNLQKKDQRAVEDNGCLASENLVSTNEDSSDAKMSISNVGASDLWVYWVGYEGQLVDYANNPQPQAIVAPGDTLDFDAFRGFVFAVQTAANECVGIARTMESRNSYSFDGAKVMPRANGAPSEPAAPQGQSDPDPRADKDYASVAQADRDACAEAHPDSPADDRDYYDCMDRGLAAVSGGGARSGDDQNPVVQSEQPEGWDRAEVYYQPAGDFCAGELGLAQNGQAYNDCYYAYPNYQPNDEISNYCTSEYANDNQRQQCIADIRQCAAIHPAGSQDFNDCAVNTNW